VEIREVIIVNKKVNNQVILYRMNKKEI
jgi:hypothetical protein